MFKFKMQLLMQNVKFRVAVVVLTIATIIAGIIYIPRNKASQVKSNGSTVLTSDQLIGEACRLLGKGYNSEAQPGFGHGTTFSPWNLKTPYNGTNNKLLDPSQFKEVDCTGLIYYAVTSCGVSTSGFAFQNPVPVDPNHWYTDANGKLVTKSSNLKFTYNGATQNIKVLKAEESVADRSYYMCADGSEVPAGTIIVSRGKKYSTKAQPRYDHGWIYIGNLGTTDAKEVAKILINEYGVNASLLINGDVNGDFTIKTFANSKGEQVAVIRTTDANSTHWRIECTADKFGTYIDNGDPRVDGTDTGNGKTVGPIYAFQLATAPVISGQYQVELVKVREDGTTVITESEATFNINGESKTTEKGVLNIVSGKAISGVNQNDTYTITETQAPEGFDAYNGEISLNVGFKKTGRKYVIDESKVKSNVKTEVLENGAKLRIYVPNTEKKRSPEGQYTLEIVKVKADGTTVITDNEATFSINNASKNTINGKIEESGKIQDLTTKSYVIEETKAPKGYQKFEGTLSFNVEFKLDESTNRYLIDAEKTKASAKGFVDKTRFEVSQDGTRITIYVPNYEPTKIHKGVDTVENQNAGYYYTDLKTNKNYTEEQLAKVLHKWVIETSIEDGIEDYSKYVITDKIDTTKLDFAGLDKVKVSLVDLENKETSLKLNEDYKVAYENDTLVVTIINKDFTSNTIKNAQVGSLKGYKFRVTFNTTFKVVNGKLAVLANAVENAENQAVLTYDIGNGKEIKTESEKPEVHTGAVSVFKYNDANGNKIHDEGEKALVGAEFKIAESKEDAMANKFVKDADGNDLVAISNEHGVATFTGLEFGGKATENGTKQSDGTYKYDWTKASKDYYIVETKAPEGFLLMTEAVKVTVSKNSSECIDLTDKMEAIANQEIKGAYDFRITKKDAETTKVIEDETTVFDIKVYSKVDENGLVNDNDLVELKDINNNTINTKDIHAKTNGVIDITNIKITDNEKKVGTYYFVIEETQAPDEYTEIDYRVVIPVKFELKDNEYVAKHNTEDAYALAKVDGKEVKKSLKDMATSNNECASSEQIGLTINVNVPNRHKDFDLSLRKFISAVNGVAPAVSREPVVDVSKLASGESTTATYTHPKNAVAVATGDIVTYTFRVYNEGEIDAYATQVFDDIPEGLEFIPGTETNKIWTMYRFATESDKETVEFDGKKYVETKDAKEANIIVTEALSKANGEGNLIKAFDGKDLLFKDVTAEFKVVEPNSSKRELENHAQITKHTDKNGNTIPVVTDRDSTPNKWVKDEDDQDYEVIKLKEYDLVLRKFISAVNSIVPEKSREPKVELDTLINGDPKKNGEKTATYIHPKDVVDVNPTDIVTYTFRVYNEGEIDAYAEQVMDDIPEGLEFIPGTETNKIWRMYRFATESDKETVEFDGKKYVETKDAKEANIIVTEALAKGNGEDKLIPAFNGKELKFQDVKAEFKVVEPKKSDRVLENHAQITKHTDKNGTPVEKVTDRDSTPNKWVKDEDDQDYENIRVRYFDLSLIKYVSKAIVIENGEKNIVETGHTGYERPEPVVKVDLKNTDLNKVTVKFEYTIKVSNDGEVGKAIAGNAEEVADYIPEGLIFLPEDNKSNWIMYRPATENDKPEDIVVIKKQNYVKTTKPEEATVAVTDEIKGKVLQPGESAEVKVVLTWLNSEDNMGIKTNVAEICKDHNEYGVPDIDSTPNNNVPGEDDIDDAPVMLTVQTGNAKQYYGVIFGVLVLLTAGVVLIKKKVIA